MFERRLKIFLGIVFGVTAVLLLRSFQLQVLAKSHWQSEALEFAKRPQLVETTRGRILDFKGKEIAIDEPCMDACVDYRAVKLDSKWIEEIATRRVKRDAADEWKKANLEQRTSMIKRETEAVKNDIDELWQVLAAEGKLTADQVEEIRRAIQQRVAMRARWVQYSKFLIAQEDHALAGPSPWYRKWLIEGGADGPNVDDFEQTVGEQVESHPVLRNISDATVSRLAKLTARYPGLTLRPGTRRKYPYGKAACHILGQLAVVNKKELEHDPNGGGVNDLLAYLPNDLIGRSGLEALCEPALRGSRGRVQRLLERDEVTREVEPQPGEDVRCSIDIELQAEVQSMFEHVAVESNLPNDHRTTEVAMHGAAVVLDIKTGQVRVLASYPDYDLNEAAEKFAELAANDLDRPFMNRATQSKLEPGSTVKPIVGLAGISEGVITTQSGIECTGYLVINGRRYPNGRCWVASKFEDLLGKDGVAHHRIPESAPHHGRYGNPDGFLCFADALERSCNVYFETVADRLGMDRLCTWYTIFGLGRRTGLGIAEETGMVPSGFKDAQAQQRSVLWFSGIGQTRVLATPIQMANVAATIARGGIWMRPRLVDADVATNPPKHKDDVPTPDRVDLKLPPDAVAAAKEGMINVVNSEGGTGQEGRMRELLVAAKTGTAQASRLKEKQFDDEGNEIKIELPPASWDHPTQTPWYRGYGAAGDKLNHAWYIGFAPANDPKVAFAVLLQYGGGGGQNAAPLAKRILIACAEHGYLTLGTP